MKKLITALILSFVFLVTYADIIGPGEPSPCYNNVCIEQCLKMELKTILVCRNSCVCGLEKMSLNLSRIFEETYYSFFLINSLHYFTFALFFTIVIECCIGYFFNEFYLNKKKVLFYGTAPTKV